MENNEIKKWRGHGLEAYRRVKHNRAYAQTEEAELCLAATALAWQEQRVAEGKNFELEELKAWLEKLLKNAATSSRPGGG